MDIQNIILALKLMEYGLFGVFTVLVLFYFMIKLLMKIFAEK